MTGRPRHAETRCRSCGDVIGVYEPMVVVLGEEPLWTSRAASADELPEDAPRFHGACFRGAEPGEER